MLKRYIQVSLALAFTLVAWAYTPSLTRNDFILEEVEPTVTPPEVFTFEPIPFPEVSKKDEIISKKIKRGDTFSDILKSNGVSNTQVQVLNGQINKLFDLKLFKAGNEYSLAYLDGKNQLSSLKYKIDFTSELIIDIEQGKVSIEEKPVAIREVKLAKKINSSLAKTLQSTSMSDMLADKILTVFAWQINFNNLKKGDYFKVVYDEEVAEEDAIGIEKIKAILFHHNEKDYHGFWFDNGFGGEFFDEDGINLSRAPIVSDQISSLFAKRRLHPVRNTYRAHYGMDFMAETGTPVFAAKDGLLLEAGFKKANGNYVKIQHEQKLVTMYLHLSEIDPRIKEGDSLVTYQQIGKVGSTGLSSGPHLCYRVFKNGKQKDPVYQDLPSRPDILSSEKNTFIESSQKLKLKLASLEL